jgi:hypothetical protein
MLDEIGDQYEYIEPLLQALPLELDLLQLIRYKINYLLELFNFI